jgi:hypothetical protein
VIAATLKACAPKRTQARHGEDRVRAGLIAVVAQHQHAGHVLPRQRDDEERQGDAQQGLQRELRHFEDRRCEAEVDCREVDAALCDEQRKADDQDADHRKARGIALEQRIGDDQHDYQQRIGAGPAEGIDAELQQDAGQQAGGNAARNHAHQLLECAGQAEHDEAQRRQDVRADDLAVGREGHHGRQKRHAGCGPGRNDGRLVAPAQQCAGDADADGNRPYPGRGLGRSQPGQLRRLEHQHEGAAVVHQHRDQGGDGGGKEVGGSEASR